MNVEPTDEGKVRTLAGRVALWWDRAKVTVMGGSILLAVLSTTWILSGTQSEIAAQIKSVATSVSELKAAFSDLSTKHENTTGTVATHDSRLARLEEWRDAMKPAFMVHQQRIMIIERHVWGMPPLPEVEEP